MGIMGGSGADMTKLGTIQGRGVGVVRRQPINPRLNLLAWGLLVCTGILVGMGGLVTSHEAGLSVPDWPTSYGYNMFLFPISLWKGGIFYEHTHRLVASLVGLLTVILAIWMWRCDPRSWARRLGWTALGLVVLQGILGGLRVTLLKAQIGIVHAALAQLFFCLVAVIALVTFPHWAKWVNGSGRQLLSRPVRITALLATVFIFGQLLLGAAMRHQHAGLAVPDFPLAYGRLWPASDPVALAQINQSRLDVAGYNPVTANQILLHMLHRIGALVILGGIGGVAWCARRQVGQHAPAARLATTWFGLAIVQACLGALTVWTNKAADMATLHVVGGAFTLATGVGLNLLFWWKTTATAPASGLDPDLAPHAAAFVPVPSLAHSEPILSSLKTAAATPYRTEQPARPS